MELKCMGVRHGRRIPGDYIPRMYGIRTYSTSIISNDTYFL